jgi:outer membrane biosynthesis protein TonB
VGFDVVIINDHPVIHFNLDDRYRDDDVVGTAISRRDGVLLSVMFHALIAAAFLIGPHLSIFDPSPEELRRQAEELERQRQEEARRIVFVRPRADIPALVPPEDADVLLDRNRRARGADMPAERENPAPAVPKPPPEPVEEAGAERRDDPKPPEPEPEGELARVLPPADEGVRREPEVPRPRIGGALGEALKNLQQYVQNETLQNPQSASDQLDATVQFDTRGIDFSSWWRRFRAQIIRNAFVPQAAMVLHGHVVLRMNIHRNGEITDLVILQPSLVEAFNKSAYGALYSSNPAPPLPVDYPLDRIENFTLIALFNEDLH